jgi:hypothetical protein
MGSSLSPEILVYLAVSWSIVKIIPCVVYIRAETVLGVAERSPIYILACLHVIVFFFLFKVSVLDFCFWALEVVEVVFLDQCVLELYYLFEINLLFPSLC